MRSPNLHRPKPPRSRRRREPRLQRPPVPPKEPTSIAAVDPQGDEEEDVSAGIFSQSGDPIAASVAVSPNGHYLTVASAAGCAAPRIGDSEGTELVAVDDASGLALMRADTLEGALVGAFSDAPPAIGDRIALGTPDANLARGELADGDTIAIDAASAVKPGSPVFDQYGRMVAILSAGDAEEGGLRPALPLAAIATFLGSQGIDPVIVTPADAPFSSDELADSARLLTEMVYCDG